MIGHFFEFQFLIKDQKCITIYNKKTKTKFKKVACLVPCILHAEFISVFKIHIAALCRFGLMDNKKLV